MKLSPWSTRDVKKREVEKYSDDMVLEHLQGVIRSLQEVQFCKYAHRLSD